MGFPEKLLAEGETLVLELRPHVKRLVRPAALLLLLTPAATWLAGIVPDGDLQGSARWAIVAAAGLALLRWSVWPFLVWWNTVYVITDRRLIMRSGVLNRRGHDMPLSRLNDVTFSHGLIDRMLGCGNLVVESAGERGQVVLDDIPRVEQVQRTLYRLSDASRSGLAGFAGVLPDRLGEGSHDDVPDDDVPDDDVPDDGDEPPRRRRGWRR